MGCTKQKNAQDLLVLRASYPAGRQTRKALAALLMYSNRVATAYENDTAFRLHDEWSWQMSVQVW